MQQLDNAKVKKLMTYRWVVWGILAFAFIIVFFHRLAAGVVKDDLIKAFGISETTFANLGSTYFYAYMIMQIPSGILADSLGARKTVSIGVLVAGIGSIIFGFAPTIFLAFTGRLLVGLGVSVVFISILKIQSQWFKEKEFATMSGLTSFVGNMGGAMAQTPLALVVAAVTWRFTFIVIGIFTILVAVFCYILIRNTPAEMGLPTINQLEGRESDDQQQKKPELIKGLIEVVTNPRTWPPFIMAAGINGSFMTMTGSFGSSYIAQVYGISKISAANYMLYAVISMAIGSILIGKISDTIGRRKMPMLIFGSVYVACWAVIVFVNGGKPPLGILIPLMIVLGFSNTAFTLGWSCAKEVNPPEITGIATSVVNIGCFLGSSVLPPILGRVFDTFGKTLPPVELYQKAFMYCFVASLISLLAGFLIKETGCRNIYRKRETLKNMQ